MGDKIIFQSRSAYNSLSFWVLEGVCAIGISFFLYRYNESPGLATVLILFLLFVFLANSRDSIVVKEDRFEITNKALLPVLSKTREYLFDQISAIEADLPRVQSSGLWDLLHFHRLQRTVKNNTLVLTLKDGQEKTVASGIYRDAFQEALKHIQQRSRIPITISGIK